MTKKKLTPLGQTKKMTRRASILKSNSTFSQYSNHQISQLRIFLKSRSENNFTFPQKRVCFKSSEFFIQLSSLIHIGSNSSFVFLKYLFFNNRLIWFLHSCEVLCALRAVIFNCRNVSRYRDLRWFFNILRCIAMSVLCIELCFQS